jgi:hypothetical protein
VVEAEIVEQLVELQVVLFAAELESQQDPGSKDQHQLVARLDPTCLSIH